MKRPLCIATVFYILGIIMGLYLKLSIAFLIAFFIFVIFILSITFITKLKRTKKYLQKNRNNIKNNLQFESKNNALIKIEDVKQINLKEKIRYISRFGILLFMVIIGITNIKQIDSKYEKFYKLIEMQEELQIEAIVISSPEEKNYSYTYEIKILKINGSEKYKGIKLLLNLKKSKQKENVKLEYGDYITAEGEFEIPDTARNYGGFDYREYLKTKNIYGTIYVKEDIEVLDKGKGNIFGRIVYKVQNSIKKNMGEILPKETSDLCVGILIGIRDDLSEEVEENFKDSNLTHMLAVSGSHITYIILGLTALLSKTDKRFSKITTILFLIFFMILTGCTASVVRACIMGIIMLISKLVYRKSDIWSNLALSTLIILALNPYTILDIGFQLSYGGTIGIVLLSKRMSEFIKQKINIKSAENQKVDIKTDVEKQKKNINNKLQYRKIDIKNLENKKVNTKRNIVNKIINYIIDTLVVTFSANIIIIPIMAFQFNTVSLTFWISNLLASPFMGVVVILGFIVYIVSLISINISKIIAIPLNIILVLFLKIAEVCSRIPFSSIIVRTPYVISIVIYYLVIILILNRKFIRERIQDTKRKIKVKNINGIKTKIDEEELKIIKNESKENLLNTIRMNNKEKLLNYKRDKIHNKKRIIKSVSCYILIFSLILAIFRYNINQNLKIYFIDVGQGDSTLIITPSNKKILIDGGGSEMGTFNVGEKTLLPYLLDRRITTLDYVMISHFDTDHVRRTIICDGKDKSKKCYYLQARRKFTKL